MKRIVFTAATLGALAVSALGLSGAAVAAPLGGAPADDVVNQLSAQGYSVQINGDRSAPLSECTVTGVSGLAGTDSNGRAIRAAGSTVYVGVSCNDDHDE